MIYVVVLPALLLYFLALGIATLVAGLTRRGKNYFPCLWRALVASLVGVTAANIAFWVIVTALLAAFGAVQPPPQVPQALRLSLALGLLVGPASASLLGVLLGILFAILWRQRSIPKGASSQPLAA